MEFLFLTNLTFLAQCEDPIHKREQFAISLRKKKANEIITAKRRKIMMSLSNAKLSDNGDYLGYPPWITDKYKTQAKLLSQIMSVEQRIAYKDLKLVSFNVSSSHRIYFTVWKGSSSDGYFDTRESRARVATCYHYEDKERNVWFGFESTNLRGYHWKLFSFLVLKLNSDALFKIESFDKILQGKSYFNLISLILF